MMTKEQLRSIALAEAIRMAASPNENTAVTVQRAEEYYKFLSA